MTTVVTESGDLKEKPANQEKPAKVIELPKPPKISMKELPRLSTKEREYLMREPHKLTDLQAERVAYSYAMDTRSMVNNRKRMRPRLPRPLSMYLGTP